MKRARGTSSKDQASISLAWPRGLVAGRFSRRPNRFVVEVRVAGDRIVKAHLADPGRLSDLLTPGAGLWLRPAVGEETERRRTAWSVVLARSHTGTLVSVDTILPNRLVAEALERKALRELRGWRLERREASAGRHRFDFLLRSGRGEPLFLEVKSVTLLEDGLGLFPDAVTARGEHHLRALTKRVEEGAARAAVLFVAQRDDVKAVAAAASIDPRFALAFQEARAAGVMMLARRCRVDLRQITLGEEIEVLPPRPAAATDLL
jgi:sugar fermentation stimulation protein A